MTPLQLLDALEAFVKQETKDILLPVRVDRKSGENKERAAEVYKMRLPNKTAQTERVPYLLLQYIKSTDTQEPGQDPESECTAGSRTTPFFPTFSFPASNCGLIRHSTCPVGFRSL